MKRLCLILICTGTALAVTVQRPQSSFLGGELSPLILGRAGVPQYESGLRTAENALVLDVGVLARRPGSVYVAPTDENDLARLEPFVYNESDAYALEFTEEKIRFLRDTGLVLDVGETVNVAIIANSYENLVVWLSSWPVAGLSAGDRVTLAGVVGTPGSKPRNMEDLNGRTFDVLSTNLVFDYIIINEAAAQYNAYASGGTVTVGGDPYDVATPYQVEDLFSLATYQSADVMYIVDQDGGYSPRKLTRNDHDDWTLEDFNDLVTTGPFRTLNATSTAVEVNAVTGTATMIADANLFDSGHIGALWKLQHVKATQKDTSTFSGIADGNSVVAGVTAPFMFDFGSVAFAGTVKLRVSYDDGSTWVDYYTATNAASAAMDVNSSGISDFGQNVLLRVSCTDFTSGTLDYELEVDSYVHTGIVRITGYTDANEATVSVLDRVGEADATTTLWAEGAWSKYRGYPTAVTGHFGRLVFASGTTVWWSAADDYENFYGGTNDDDAFSYTLSQARQNPTRWMVGERSANLLLGTLGKVMELRSLDELAGFTPTNPPKVSSTSAVTVGAPLPALTENVALFCDRTGRRVYELLYDDSAQSITTPDLTLMASHITGTGVKQMAWQRSPYPILWCVRNDGEMATLYYNRSYEIAAWSRQITDGDYLSVAAVPISGGYDRVWAVVERTVDSNTVRYLEYFDDIDLDVGIEDVYYVDSGLTWNGGAAATISSMTQANPTALTLASWPPWLADGADVRLADLGGMTELDTDFVYQADDCNATALTLTLDYGASDVNTIDYTAYTSGGTLQVVESSFGGLAHLEGKTVTVLADGAAYGTEVVASGSITLDDAYNQVAIGLPYTTTITPTGIDVADSGGSTMPFYKKEVGLYLNAYRTQGGNYGPVTTNMKEIQWPRSSSAFPTTPELFTGPYVARTFSGARRDAGYTVTQADPYPFVLRSMITIFETNP